MLAWLNTAVLCTASDYKVGLQLLSRSAESYMHWHLQIQYEDRECAPSTPWLLPDSALWLSPHSSLLPALGIHCRGALPWGQVGSSALLWYHLPQHLLLGLEFALAVAFLTNSVLQSPHFHWGKCLPATTDPSAFMLLLTQGLSVCQGVPAHQHTEAIYSAPLSCSSDVI